MIMSESPDHLDRLRAEVTALQGLLKLIEPWTQDPQEPVSAIINRMFSEISDDVAASQLNRDSAADLQALAELAELQAQAWPPRPGEHQSH